MAATKLGLYELLAPQFLAGFRFPAAVDRYLSFLDVDALHSAADESGVVYTGTVSFREEVGAAAVREHEERGALFRWEDVTVDFRLTIPRDGAQFIDDAASAMAAGAPADPDADDLDLLFTALGPVEQSAGVATEFPGIRFRLELLLTSVTLHLGNSWVPGKLAAGGRIVPDPELTGQDVRFLLPKVVFAYEQGDDFENAPSFRVKSWGNSGFDAPADLEQGELVRMEPPLALRKDGRYAFSVDQLLVDFSAEHTPPEILEFFGTDESFEGLFLKNARFYYSDPDKDFVFNFAVKDVLLSFAGELSFEASVDLLFEIPVTLGISAELTFFDHRGKLDTYTRGTSPELLPPYHTFTNGRATVPQTAVLHLDVSGGVPNYTISVKIDGEEIFDPVRGDARVSPGMPATLRPVSAPDTAYTLVVTITDAAKATNTFSETIALTVTQAPRETPPDRLDGSPADRPGARDNLEPAEFRPDGPEMAALSAGFGVSHRPSPRGTSETILIVSPPSVQPTAKVGGVEKAVVNGRLSFDVPEGSDAAPISIEVTFPAIPAPAAQSFGLLFDRNRPKDSGNDVARHVADDANNPPSPLDVAFRSCGGRAALRAFVEGHEFASVALHAHASFQQDSRDAEDQGLSERRLQVARQIIGTLASVSDSRATGNRERPSGGEDNTADQVVVVTGIYPAIPARTVHATIARKRRAPTPPPPPGEVIVPPERTPPRPQTGRPPVWKRLSFRTRFERNDPVMGEVSGTLDFETKAEETIRQGMRDAGQTVQDTDRIRLQQTDAASSDPRPQDGLVDFKLNVAYDSATHQLTETLTFGDVRDEVNGLLRVENLRGVGQPQSSENRLIDIFGAVLVFAPIINKAAAALDPGSAGDWAALTVALGTPVAIGALDVFRTKTITLFSGEGRFRQFLPPGEDAVDFTDFGVVFDYRVEFEIDSDLLGLHSTKPLKVRYKAVGFNLHLAPGETFYQPIFDTSNGYEVDLSDPGLLDLPAPLGSVLKIAAARIARFNPLTFEADLALKADLGVVTVDTFKVKIPLDPPGAPMILPSGVKVDIPGSVVGSGYVNILEHGLEGAIDVTIIPAKLRVAANVGVQSIEDAVTQRKAVAVLVGLIVDFPTPIVIAASGLGIYGFSGLFAMHYRRTETPASPGDSVAPALRWLERAGGEPQLIARGGDQLWVPEFDRWSFGVGAVLGTVEGGFLMNFRGMLILELPGPRILLLVKVQIVQELPGLGDGELTVGILGAIDLDFNLGQITIGVIIDAEIKELISIRLPVEIFFKTGDARQWHLYIGTIPQPASALILNLVRAQGYFMFEGDKITGFPGANGPVTLPGIAVAVGLKASLLLGKESVRLYLRCAAEAHLAVAFSPFFIAGLIRLSGELRLFIVSIEATGTLTVKAPDPTIVRGEVCGKVSFFFFSVKGCVGLTIGGGSHDLPAPPLVRNAYLQSHAPVISAGQGTDRAIDATLGDAVMLTEPAGGVPAGAAIPVVPIDSVPVLQFHAAPRVSDGTTATVTFTTPLEAAPNLTAGGWIDVGGGRQVRYFLKEVMLDPPLPTSLTRPPATWRKEQSPGPQGVNTNVDLALFSRVPVTASRALERSTELNGQIRDRWSGLCDPVAPPACVLWTFGGQPLGPSGEGWHLTGIPTPDPPDTHRHAPPPTDLFVEEPVRALVDELLDLPLADAALPFEIPAKVIGSNANAATDLSPGTAPRTCIDFRRLAPGPGPNPRRQEGVSFVVRSAAARRPDPQSQIRRVGARLSGLDCLANLEITLPQPAAVVELLLAHEGGAPRAEAFNQDGTRAPRTTTGVRPDHLEELTFRGGAIRRVVVRVSRGVAVLCRLCFQPINPVPGLQALDRHRALQMPWSQERTIEEPVALPDRAREYAENRPNNQWITLHTGLAVRVRLFVAIEKRVVSKTIVRQIAATGAVVREQTVNQLTPVAVTGTTSGLPGDWIDPAGPWDEEVLPAAAFVAGVEFGHLQRLLIDFEPHPESVRIQILLPEGAGAVPTPAALLVAVEVCSKAEVERVEEGQSIQTGEIETLSGYLNGGDIVPLLEPDRTYTLTIRYDAESKAADNTTSTEAGLQQRFRFRTDAREPARLDPYVLGTTPDHEERFHFYEEPLKLVFNDVAVVQLFAAYGKKLRTVVRAADGIPVAPDELTTLDPIVGEFSTPYRDLLAALIAAGFLPCVGEVSSPVHGSYTSPVTLRPLMGYTFDVELDPPTPPPADTAVVPLYRRSFATSRFATLAALVADLRKANIQHRALAAPLTALPGASVAVATDEQIQEALRAAGEQALPAPETTGVTIYWVPGEDDSAFRPHVILIDAAEPLWRTRSEPRLETVPDQDDPAFQRVVTQHVPSLELVEPGGASIAQFIHSPSGTRTLAMISPAFVPPTDGENITITARRTASALYGIPEEIVPLVSITFRRAPWEDDEP